MKRYKFHAYKNCETCEGSGFIVTGVKAGFDIVNMEVTCEDDGYNCPECEQKSIDAYENYCETYEK